MITDIIQESLKKSYSYSEYKDLIDNLLAQNKTTGEDHSESMLQYSKLNRQRMKRLDKTLNINEEDLSFFDNNLKKQIWLIISEAWCADASQIVPVLHKIAEQNPNIDLKIVLRDENEELMNQFLTNGGKAIPMLISVNPKLYNVNFVWGPRPATATKMVENYKAEYGKLTTEFKEELQKWYNNDKGLSIINDLKEIVKNQ